MVGKFSVRCFLLSLAILSKAAAAQPPCPFAVDDEGRLARCLLRPVTRGGNVGQMPEELPETLRAIIGSPLSIDAAKLRRHLTDNRISEAEIGGALQQNAPRTRFFVIHDTSSPEIREATFPADINTDSWAGNRLASWLGSSTPTHVFVNRLGASATKNDFGTAVRGTKYEAGRDITNAVRRRQVRRNRAGLFIHIELIQPRRRSNPRTFFDLAPDPGFTDRQYERLALLYIAGSYRSNRWLLPAFHAAVDASIADAHDDPQNFDLTKWLASVSALIEKVKR